MTYLGSWSKPHSQGGAVYLPNGVSPALCVCTHGYAMFSILEVKEVKDEENISSTN